MLAQQLGTYDGAVEQDRTPIEPMTSISQKLHAWSGLLEQGMLTAY